MLVFKIVLTAYIRNMNHGITLVIPGDSFKRPAFDKLLLPEYISDDILQYLIE